MLASLSCLVEQRLSNYIKYLSFVVHHQRTIGENLSFPMPPFSNRNTRMQGMC
uniref:Uncharacterized protein n=1 Tax=Arundo donax TaxID=35708 RepID=A0A0A9EKY5_ARUDO